MFDIDAGKLLIIGVIALVVLGPKELPRVLRQVGAIIGKMRRMAAEFQSQFMDAMKESEMDDLKKDVQKIADQARVDINYDPVAETDREIRGAIQGDKKKSAAPADEDPDFSVYSVDVPPPPDTPDAAATVHTQANSPSTTDGPGASEPSKPSEPAPAAPKKSGEA